MRYFVLPYHGVGPGGVAIRFASRKTKAHAAVVFANEPRTVGAILFEALMGPGVIERVTNARDIGEDVVWLEYADPLTAAEVFEALKFAYNQKGKGYDHDNIWLGFLLRVNRTGEEKQREREGREVWHCSELPAAIGVLLHRRSRGMPNRLVARNAEPCEIDPGDLDRSLAYVER